MIISVAEMKQMEQSLFNKGVDPCSLMEIAGHGISKVIQQFFPEGGIVVVYCGKGNNAGDALVVARYLENARWKVYIKLAFSIDKITSLAYKNLQLLKNPSFDIPNILYGNIVLLDGLLGIGSSGTPYGSVSDCIHDINQKRKDWGASVVSVDIPSGLNADTGEYISSVQADITVTVGAVKKGLVSDSATMVVGRLALIKFPEMQFYSSDRVIFSDTIRSLLPPRNFDSHKGMFGKIGIVAGSVGMLGAAFLCSSAAVLMGGGLVTLFVLSDVYPLVKSIPEVMIVPVKNYTDILDFSLDSLAIGPGLGCYHAESINQLIVEFQGSAVVDADALNMLNLSRINDSRGERLLTPHPKELDRLFPKKNFSREEWATQFIDKYDVTLLLKGARTIIAKKGILPLFNTTGNPGMGSGGIGDVLTGMLSSLLGQGKSSYEASLIGAWLLGRAAELSLINRQISQESLIASSILKFLGPATYSLRRGDF